MDTCRSVRSRRESAPKWFCRCPEVPRGSATRNFAAPRSSHAIIFQAPSKCSWPTNSSIVAGRIDPASGCEVVSLLAPISEKLHVLMLAQCDGLLTVCQKLPPLAQRAEAMLTLSGISALWQKLHKIKKAHRLFRGRRRARCCSPTRPFRASSVTICRSRSTAILPAKSNPRSLLVIGPNAQVDAHMSARQVHLEGNSDRLGSSDGLL